MKQPTELGREHAEEKFIDAGEQPRVADNELEASQRQIRGLGVSSWKMRMRFVLNRSFCWSSLDVSVGLRNHRDLLQEACHTPELWLWRAPRLLIV